MSGAELRGYAVAVVLTALGFIFGGPIVGCVLLFIGIVLFVWSRYWNHDEVSAPSVVPRVEPIVKPSLLFVFGAPLGDNNSATWVMVLRHYGPHPAYNCDITFYDDDRKNIEHQWLTAHPESPYPPPGLAAGDSQKRLHIAETNAEGSAGSFTWKPLDPDRQHYTVSISCRDGVFAEKWEVTRVDGILRSSILIERGAAWTRKNPNFERVVFRCRDAEFISTPLAAELPKSSAANVVHPGWKPSYKFAVPTAIIDPNGNLQVMSGVKLPDGSTRTEFGCWNILTTHFGDKPD